MTQAKRVPEIHFAALIGVDVDADFLPWWLPFYAALALDSYTVFLHESLYESRNREAETLIRKYGFSVRRVPENALRDNPDMPGCPEGVRRTLIKTFAATLHPNDFLITADGDEIQQWPENPHSVVKRGVTVMFGRMVDRYDDTLHNPYPGKTLEENYPGEIDDLHVYFNDFSLVQKKICMAPANFPVEFSGSHDFTQGEKIPSVAVYSGPIRVLHYRWRESAIRRVENRVYWKPESIAAMKKFFSVEG